MERCWKQHGQLYNGSLQLLELRAVILYWVVLVSFNTSVVNLIMGILFAGLRCVFLVFLSLSLSLCVCVYVCSKWSSKWYIQSLLNAPYKIDFVVVYWMWWPLEDHHHHHRHRCSEHHRLAVTWGAYNTPVTFIPKYKVITGEKLVGSNWFRSPGVGGLFTNIGKGWGDLCPRSIPTYYLMI